MKRAPFLFDNRIDAGRKLAQLLAGRTFEQPVVYALPRGGVPVAREIAKALGAPLDLVLVRKIGHPSQPELALAAVIDGAAPEIVVNEAVRSSLPDADRHIREIGKKELAEIERRRSIYLKDRMRVSPQGKTAIVVDDGIATGATIRAALKALRRRHPARLVLAVPVAPGDVIEELRLEVDDIVCLAMPEPFYSVGAHYRDFSQLTDKDVTDTLKDD